MSMLATTLGENIYDGKYIMTTGPQNNSEIYTKLLESLEQNGQLSDRERNRLMLLALTGIFGMVMPLTAKVHKLEDTNIVMWIGKHQRLTGIIATGSVLAAMFLHQIAPWVISHLAILTGIK